MFEVSDEVHLLLYIENSIALLGEPRHETLFSRP
jgi:hypothetical protein